MCFEARRIHGQRLLQQPAGFVAVSGVDRLSGQKNLGVDVGGIDFEGVLRHRDCLRRIVVGKCARRTDQGGRPFLVCLQRNLIGLQRFGRAVFLQEQIAPGGVDGRIATGGPGRVAIGCIGLLKTAEGAQGAGRAGELDGILRRVGSRGDLFERGGRFGPAEHLLKQPELERRVTRRRARRRRPQRRISLRVPPARDRGARFQRHDVRVARVELVRQRVDFVVPSLDEGAGDDLERLRWCGPARPLRNHQHGAQRYRDARNQGRNVQPARQRQTDHGASYYI